MLFLNASRRTREQALDAYADSLKAREDSVKAREMNRSAIA